MQIFLELSGHPKANIKRVALAGTTVVGRSKLCGLQIASASISRKHCEIRLGDDTATIIDLGSSNGTFIGSERLTAGEELPLSDGSRLNVGGVRFLVSYTDPREAKAAPTADSAARVNGEPQAEAAALAAAVPVVDEPLSTEDEPLSLDDDDLLSFAEEEQAGESATTEADEAESSHQEQAAPITAGEDDGIAADDSRNEEPILGGEGLLTDDSAVEAPVPVEPDVEAPVATESTAEPGERNGVPAEETFEEFVETEDSGGSEGEILGDLDDDDPILAFDDDDEPLSDNMPSDSDVKLEDSTPLFTEDNSRNGKPAAPTMPAIDTTAEDSLEDDSEDEELAEENYADEDYYEEDSEAITADDLEGEQGDEPILEDEDEAFAFLNDDDNQSKPKSSKNDSQLGDFLSQLGRD